MRIVSDSLIDDFKLQENIVVRFNLAWNPDIDSLLLKIRKISQTVLIDYPFRRTKPPIVKYEMGDLRRLTDERNVEYLAISNIRCADDLRPFVNLGVVLIPKIEDKIGISNIEQIVEYLPYDKPHIMLDKEDLYTNTISEGVAVYESCIAHIEGMSNICLLNLAGVVFNEFGDRSGR